MSKNKPIDINYAMKNEVPIEKTKVNLDQESWLIDRLETLVNLSKSINSCKRVCADDPAIMSALDGAIHGTAEEIIFTLGLIPSYINIRPSPKFYSPISQFGTGTVLVNSQKGGKEI